MIKKYRVQHGDNSVIVQIDHNLVTPSIFSDMNSFWSGSENRVCEHGSSRNAVLKMLAGVCLRLQVELDLTLRGVIERFNWSSSGNGIEGWPNMDGSEGIKLLYVDTPYFQYDDMYLTEYTGPLGD